MTAAILNKRLYTDINRLKLQSKSELHGCFILDQSPFDDDDFNEDEGSTATASNRELAVVGRIFPNTEIYNQGSYQIKIIFTSYYPTEPPKVKFLTRIYHPNISQDGNFCYELLNLLGAWTRTTSLLDIIRTVVKYLDQPNLEMFEVQQAATEYLHERSVFNQKALEYVKRYALPRFVEITVSSFSVCNF